MMSTCPAITNSEALACLRSFQTDWDESRLLPITRKMMTKHDKDLIEAFARFGFDFKSVDETLSTIANHDVVPMNEARDILKQYHAEKARKVPEA